MPSPTESIPQTRTYAGVLLFSRLALLLWLSEDPTCPAGGQVVELKEDGGLVRAESSGSQDYQTVPGYDSVQTDSISTNIYLGISEKVEKTCQSRFPLLY